MSGFTSLNLCQFIGHVVDDAEIREADGRTEATFSVAVSESYKDGNGDLQESTELVRCCALDRLAEVCGQCVKTGRLVFVEGKLQTRGWKDRDGNQRYSTQVVLSSVQLLDRIKGTPAGAKEEKK